jgi:XTP/dITP diphosphohydrolase
MEGKEDRTAVAKAAIGICEPGSEPVVIVGEKKGRLSLDVKGREGFGFGFGFDFIFIPEGHEQTYSEMGMEKKNKLSHRKEALEKLREYLKKSENVSEDV